MNRPVVSNFKLALKSCYGWKPPVVETKNGELSLALQFVALAFFVSRIGWILQLVKLLLRWLHGPEQEIPPWLQEVYVIASLCAESLLCALLGLDPTLGAAAAGGIGALCLWKAAETLTSNLYYAFFRPILERKMPHSDYRSLVLTLFGCVEIWLLLSLAWHFIGHTLPGLQPSIFAALYYGCSFFAAGAAEIHPQGNFSLALFVCSKFTALAMLAVALARGIAILRPPGNRNQPPA